MHSVVKVQVGNQYQRGYDALSILEQIFWFVKGEKERGRGHHLQDNVPRLYKTGAQAPGVTTQKVVTRVSDMYTGAGQCPRKNGTLLKSLPKFNAVWT
jgi:hypothetical protein